MNCGTDKKCEPSCTCNDPNLVVVQATDEYIYWELVEA